MMDAMFPAAASEHAGRIDNMIDVVHYLMLALFIVWSVFFVYVLMRFRASRNPKADYVGVKSKASTYGEVAVAIAEGVLLLGFSIPMWAERVDEVPPESDATVVRVVAQQFAWNVWYPGADGEFGAQNLELIDEATNPIGLDRDDPAGGRRHLDREPVAPSGRQAGDHPPVVQGRDPQLQPAEHADQAGHDSGHLDPGLVRARRRRRPRFARRPATRTTSTRSPAPSSAATATTRCAAS